MLTIFTFLTTAAIFALWLSECARATPVTPRRDLQFIVRAGFLQGAFLRDVIV